jgi:chromosome segregation ATPase
VDLDGAGWAGVGTVVGGGLTAVGAWVRSVLKDRRESATADRREAVQEAYKLIDKLRQDVDRADQKAERIEAELDQVREDHARCERRYGIAEERISSLEDALTGAGIKFRPWRGVGDGGSADHPAVPPGDHP